MTESDHLQQIIYDRDFDFTDVFNRSPTKRPEGNIMLVILIQPSFRRSCKLCIIKNDNSYFIIGQLKVKVTGKEQIQHSQKIIAYHKDHNRKAIPDIFDIDCPSYNVEWHFEISELFYNSIFEAIAKIFIPLKSSESGLDGITRVIYVNQTLPLNIEWWKYKDTQWDELTNFTDDLFTFALTKFDTAYFRG